MRAKFRIWNVQGAIQRFRSAVAARVLLRGIDRATRDLQRQIKRAEWIAGYELKPVGVEEFDKRLNFVTHFEFPITKAGKE